MTILLNDSKNGDFKKQADFNVDSLDAIISLITSKEMFVVDREDAGTDHLTWIYASANKEVSMYELHFYNLLW